MATALKTKTAEATSLACARITLALVRRHTLALSANTSAKASLQRFSWTFSLARAEPASSILDVLASQLASSFYCCPLVLSFCQSHSYWHTAAQEGAL